MRCHQRDAKSRAEWISYALGTLGLSAVGTKGLGAVSKTGMTTVKATAKVGVHKVKAAAQKIPTLNLYPYAPQHQLAGVTAGIVPYNTVNSVGLRDQLISMAKMEARGSGKGIDNPLLPTEGKVGMFFASKKCRKLQRNLHRLAAFLLH